MKETNISKRIISFLLVLSMIFGTMTTLAFADGDWTADTFNFDDPSVLIAGTNETNMPYMETVLLKSTDSGYEEVQQGTLKTNDTVLIGVKAHNFDRFTDNSYGALKLAVSLVYDNRYLTPTSATKKAFLKAETAFVTKAGDKCFYNDDILGTYSIEQSIPKQDLAPGETSSLSDDTSNLSKSVLTFSCAADNDTDLNEQMGVIKEDSYLGFFEYTVSSVPTAGVFTPAVAF